MSTELNTIIEPVINLIKELFALLYLQFKTANKDVKSSINSNQKIKDYKLDKLFDLLTFDISPCLQKAILTIFLYQLNKNGNFLYILLYLLKASLFDDIKSIIYDFTIILFNENCTNASNANNVNTNNTNQNSNISIRQYIDYNLLPYYLLIEW